ncbi:MAG: hypothetical protein KC484_07270 [Colwelliaceae bacterium]|nr:hypothetical protein [Colwelliaceae bacterium]
MKRINNVLVIVTIVLGLGTTASASANESSIEDTLKKIIVKQSQQVSDRLTKQLKQSIKLELNEMSLLASSIINQKNDKSINKNQLVKRNIVANTTHTTTEDE